MSAGTLRLSVRDVVDATGGKLVRGSDRALAGISTDSRKIVSGGLFIGVEGERFDGSDFGQGAIAEGASAVIVSEKKARAITNPGDASVIAVDSGVRALGLLARWHRRRMPARIVAITGSNGKTTTKEMAAAICAVAGRTLATEGNLNNEIGVPTTLFGLRPDTQYAVVELGMNHEGEIGRLTAMTEPHVGVVTVAAPVHIEHFGTLENISRAKGELYTGLTLDGLAVANADDTPMTKRAELAGRRTIWFGRHERADVRLLRVDSHDRRGIGFTVAMNGSEYAVQVPVVGDHNAMNACAALAIAKTLGIPVNDAIGALAKARPPGRRLLLSDIDGADATLLDDCYNANPHSAVAALRTLCQLAPAGQRIAVIGDMRELGDFEEQGHREVGVEAAASGLKLLVAFGPASRNLADEARLRGLDIDRIVTTDDPKTAADHVRSVLGAGDVVLVKASRGTRLERVSDLLAPARMEAH